MEPRGVPRLGPSPFRHRARREGAPHRQAGLGVPREDASPSRTDPREPRGTPGLGRSPPPLTVPLGTSLTRLEAARKKKGGQSPVNKHSGIVNCFTSLYQLTDHIS